MIRPKRLHLCNFHPRNSVQSGLLRDIRYIRLPWVQYVVTRTLGKIYLQKPNPVCPNNFILYSSQLFSFSIISVFTWINILITYSKFPTRELELKCQHAWYKIVCKLENDLSCRLKPGTEGVNTFSLKSGFGDQLSSALQFSSILILLGNIWMKVVSKINYNKIPRSTAFLGVLCRRKLLTQSHPDLVWVKSSSPARDLLK